MLGFGPLGFRRFLTSSSSAAALIAGAAAIAPITPAMAAACTTSLTGNTAGCTNNAVLTTININSATVTSGVINNGTISPNGISINTSSTLQGGVIGNGTIAGGISIDSTSTITGAVGAINVGATTFSGNISSAGTVLTSSAGTNAIAVHDGTFSGNIVISGGTVSAPSAVGVAVYNENFVGSISNNGTITAHGAAIGVGTFAHPLQSFGTNTPGGGIVNSGNITSSAGTGIEVFKVQTFLGGVTNSGHVTVTSGGQPAVQVRLVTSFAGNVSNSGTIGGHVGIGVTSGISFGTTAAGGGIVNSGTIHNGNTGVLVNHQTTFLGGISSSGTISAAGAAVELTADSTFAGGIAITGGTVTARDGIRFGTTLSATSTVSNFSGGITNSGTVTVTGNAVVLTAVSTFSGGIVNSSTGTMAGGYGIVLQNVSNFSGGISNAGHITAGTLNIGIFVGSPTNTRQVRTFIGGIINSGTISAGFQGIAAGCGNAFSGGVTNASGGTITARTGIQLRSYGSVSGDVVNAGNINATQQGIIVGGTNATYGISSFANGITNSGAITSSNSQAIYVDKVSTFSGAIVNSANSTLSSAKTGILVTNVQNFGNGITNDGLITTTANTGIVVNTVSAFSGGINNAGNITAGTRGIYVGNSNVANGVSTFSGGITNAGTISATGTGVVVQNVVSFAGNIVNSSGATLTARTGINVSGVSSFIGAISNAGTISGLNSAGISVSATTVTGGITNAATGHINGNDCGVALFGVGGFAGGITNAGTITGALTAGIHLRTVSSFGGGINNTGTISGGIGILVDNGSSTFAGGITNAGTISGTGGTAIDISTVSNAVGITQAGGTIIGDIDFSTHGDTLAGYGVVTGNLVDSSHNVTYAPGLGGTGAGANILQINHALTLTATNKVVIEVSPAAAAQLSVGGALALGNAPVAVVFDPGTYSNKTYTIVHATGAIAGTLGTLTTSGATPAGTQTITYPDANDVDLVLAGVPAPTQSSPVTVTTPTGILGDAGMIGLNDFFDSDDAIFDHLDEVGQTSDGVKTALASAAPMQIAMNGSMQQIAQLGSNLPTAVAQSGGWVRGIGAFQSARSQGAVSGYSASGGGFLAGIDHVFGPFTVGIAGGYSGTNLTQKDGSTGDIETPRAMVYARWHVNPQVVVDGLAGVAWDQIHTSRPIASLGAKATESHNGTEENIALQAGYKLPWQAWTLIPRVGAQYVHLTQQGFSESGASGFDLTAPRSHLDSFQPIVSVAALRPFTLDSGMTVVPELKLSYSHELLDTSQTLALTTPAGSVVPGTILTPARNTLTIGPQVTAQMTQQLSLYADYKAVIGLGKSLDNVVFAGARYAW